MHTSEEEMEEDKSTSASDLISNRTSKDHRAFEEMDWDLVSDKCFLKIFIK